jgi:DNA-binding MarR family transcriptional regulator
MNELSRDMGVTISTMTRAVDVLVRNDIVIRKENPKDRRQVFIELTEKGRDYHQKLKKCSEDTSKAILDQIPPQQRKNILNSLRLLVNAVDSCCQKCCQR